jgi:hypothetical protein
MEDDIGGNAIRLVGEVFIPGASQFVAGNIGSGIAHNLLAGAAGVALIGTGVAPVIGALAILGIKLNSFASATTGRSLLNMGSEVFDRERARFEAPPRTNVVSSPAAKT